EITERQGPARAVVKIRRSKLLRRRPAEEALSCGEERYAELLEHAAIHFSEPHLQKNLLALVAARHLQKVDDRPLRRRSRRDLAGAQHHVRARDLTRENRRVVAAAYL